MTRKAVSSAAASDETVEHEDWSLPPSHQQTRALVALDRSGAVVPQLRRYAGRAAAYGALSLLGSIFACSVAAADPLVMALSLVGTAAWGHGLLVTHWLEQSSALMLQGELDRAEVLLQRCLRPPWGSEGVRAHAHLRLWGVYSRRGEHLRALAESQAAIALFLDEYPPQPQFVQLARYQQIRSLVSADRQADARLQLEELSQVPSGDYLRVQHFLTELYVALGDNRLPFLDGPLWERTQLAQQSQQGASLLGLCAWGFHKLGEDALAQSLLTQLQERPDAEPLEQMLPKLAQFVRSFAPVLALPAAAGEPT